MNKRWCRWLIWMIGALILGLGLHSGLGLASPSRSFALPKPAQFAALPTTPVSTLPSATLDSYRPVAPWVGRLILPSQAEAAADEEDWVWIELSHSPDPALTGQTLRLEWGQGADIQAYRDLVSRALTFTETTLESQAKGNIHPERLNGWSRVGPLQTLAGTRPQDDMWVSLSEVTVLPGAEGLALNAIPVQVPDRFYGLVQVLGPAPGTPAPAACPGEPPCPSNFLRVRHYTPDSAGFDGPEDVLHFPQSQPNSGGIFPSTARQLADSPAGAAGWYVYGAPGEEGVFQVSAIAPRRLFQIQPQVTLASPSAALNYIRFGNWRNTPDRKGTIQSVQLATATDPAETSWQVGDRGLVIHLFGGIGGELAESQPVVGTVTGHFSFGTATVIAEPIAQEPQFAITYDQVYAHNPNGIVSGRTTWAEYMGHLGRGWLGTRPVSDGIIRFPPLTRTYDFGEVSFSPLDTLQRQLAMMMARYRSGDGTGAALVTPSQSCVQDSNQALYETIETIKAQVQNTPSILQWLADHPEDSQTQDFQALVTLGNRLARTLVPLGVVRPDWRANVAVLQGIQAPGDATPQDNLLTQILSWRTIIPRVAYDDIATVFLNQQADLWFLRTNQVGGDDPAIAPLAPTELFGRYLAVPTLFSRLIESLRWPNLQDFALTLGALGLYGAIALPVGLATGFVQFETSSLRPIYQIALGTKLLILPALAEEVVWRVLLLPHPTEGVLPVTATIWTGLSLSLFVLSHPFSAHWFYKPGKGTFFQPVFLGLATVLGLVCTGVYLLTGALWTVVGIHWVVVLVWLLGCGGYGRMYGKDG